VREVLKYFCVVGCYVALVKGFGVSVGIELRLRVGLLPTIDSKFLIFFFFYIHVLRWKLKKGKRWGNFRRKK